MYGRPAFGLGPEVSVVAFSFSREPASANFPQREARNLSAEMVLMELLRSQESIPPVPTTR